MSSARLLPWILALLAAGAEAFTAAPALRAAARVTPARNPRHAPRMSLQSIEPEPRMSGAIIHKGLVYTCGMVCEEGGEGKDVKQQTKVWKDPHLRFPRQLAAFPLPCLVPCATPHLGKLTHTRAHAHALYTPLPLPHGRR
eukprot:3940548-Rhodomonas_salina.6